MVKGRGQEFQAGDWVIYHKTKWSSHPGPRARDIKPSPGGDQYAYCIDKFWVVDEVRSDGSIVLITRTGKRHILDSETPTLRRATWFDRLRFRSRFEAVEMMNREDSAPVTSE
ncbi:hypothetical protein KOR42_52020 [Thalassoglobus neptunius]|uniref:Uncharacterized protein n=2 Tax=Thalassoglobus neptunius TaxID=1938619 RepID=A0A5C5VAX6_9PLAN|nr:hypothetical protein KOR42_52020 [Thalassoglobus neptunius]